MINGHGVSNKSSDECYTPEYAVLPLLKYLSKDMKIWCPFDKPSSAYVRIFEDKGYNVICSHIDEGGDFFEYEPEEYDIIISNPPFSLSFEILTRLYDLGKPFIMLMPLKYLQAKNRGKLFVDNGIQLLSFNERIGYYTNGDMTKPKEGNYQASSYFCWRVLPRDLIIEKLNKTPSINKAKSGSEVNAVGGSL